MSWHPFSRIDDGFAKESFSSVTAIARNPDSQDLFVSGTDGGVYSTWWESASGWAWWFRIDGGFDKAATSVAVVARKPDSLDLFVTGSDGGVYSTWWDSAGGWAYWFRIDEGFAQAATSVAAVTRNPDSLDLFVTGSDGRVYWTWWRTSSGWASFWYPLDTSFTKAAASVTAVARTPDSMNLFVTGTDGRVYSTWWSSEADWASWFQIDTGFTKTATSVTAVARTPDSLDLFVTGKDRRVYSTWWNSNDGWAWWFPIDDGFAKARSPVAAVARTPDSLDLFVTGKDGAIYSTWWDASGWAFWFRIDHTFTSWAPITSTTRDPNHVDLFIARFDEHYVNGGVYSTYWDPSPATLRGVTITFNTHDAEKDDATFVHVFVKNRLNNSLTPQQDADFISNWLALERCNSLNEIDGERNPYLAYAYFLGRGDEWDDPSSQTFQLTLVSDDISVNDIVLPEVNIHILADSDDSWIFDYRVTLTFDNGEFSFVSTTDGAPGIILDKYNRNHSGIGIENPLRTLPLPVFTKPTTNAILKKVTLEFATHGENGSHDGKDGDTQLNVRIVNRISDTSTQDIAVGLDLFHGQAFPDSGTRDDLYRPFSWAVEDGTLVNTIRLADIVLPVVYIVIVPNGDDTWIFDYRVTFEFEDAGDFEAKRRTYSSQTNGVILDQDNNKHVGVYQGPPFPTVTPPTAPRLTLQPIDHTGTNRKEISISFVQQKFDEFIKNRNGADTDENPPLRKIHLSSSPMPEGGGLRPR